MRADVPRVALIAHDEKKQTIVELAGTYEDTLSNFDLVGTGTTARRIRHETDLDIESKRSGNLGGDAQIAAEVAADETAAFVLGGLDRQQSYNVGGVRRPSGERYWMSLS